MNKQIRRIVVMSFTIFTLSACSNGGTTTTAALEGTTSLTSAEITTPVTTPADTALTSTTMPTTTPPATATTAIATTTPQSTSETKTSTPAQSDGDVAKAFQKSVEFMTSLDSYRVTNLMKSNTFGMNIETTTIMDYYPKENSYKTVIEVAGMKMESYLIGNQIYTNIPGSGWMLTVMDEPEPTAEEALSEFKTDELIDLFSFEETAEGYILKTKRALTNLEMDKLGPAFGGLSDGQDANEIEDDIKIAYELEIHLNKNYSNNKTLMTMVINMEEMVINSEVQAVYSDFNKLEPFKLPEEAKDAQEITFPMP